ncbi:hypothetical protein TSUD_148910 [Trifolium subterraneum]|uniref:Uncharacterized protein n=1 Tax=Trifolium subterraneum TaxID=3900 RepID=A0A2Z6MLV1_TRISU|nr:hypothetical protein TSUD_148910 [Trifolium subterraneum]
MAAMMDFYSYTQFHNSDPFRGELMEVLEPFIKSPSSTSTSTQSPSYSSSSSSSSFLPSFSSLPPLYTDGFYSQNFIGFTQPSSSSSLLGLNHLTPSQINQIQTQIQQQNFTMQQQQQRLSLAEMQKQGKTEKPKKTSAARSKAKAAAAAASSETVTVVDDSVVDLKKGSEGCCKVEVSSSPVSEGGSCEGSSPLSDLTFGDVGEQQWEGDLDNFNLLKYPSYEIDWDSL